MKEMKEMKEMKGRGEKPVNLTEFLLDAMELVADLDVNDPNLMKELAKAKVALRNFNKTMQIEPEPAVPKPLKLLAR